ncbi:hypothetical protein LTR53_005370 [Teratosphaeriaceae sp. CCFEE 6253]|nr:hypothetical protein LTR53_005370 [Teratosphaeriaceae sp. CCFEE 6253]
MPGAGKQAPEVQDKIKDLLEAGFDPTTIHRKLKVGRSSIYRMKRCLQQHGSAYMPTELNKKNGRPKVLTAEQELEVRDWLRDPKNRNRYLDDLVWLIHDRFGIICSTTTMSKLKRKWIKVIESEEGGRSLEDSTSAHPMAPHTSLSNVHDEALFEAPMMPSPPPANTQLSDEAAEEPHERPLPPLPLYHPPAPHPIQQSEQHIDSELLPRHHDPQIDSRSMSQQYAQRQEAQEAQHYKHHEQQRYPVHEPQIDARLLHHQHQQQPPTDPLLHSPYYTAVSYP